MNPLDLLRSNLSTPMVLGFALSLVAALVKGNIKLPEAIHSTFGA